DRVPARDERIVERKLTPCAPADGKLPLTKLEIVVQVAQSKTDGRHRPQRPVSGRTLLPPLTVGHELYPFACKRGKLDARAGCKKHEQPQMPARPEAKSKNRGIEARKS